MKLNWKRVMMVFIPFVIIIGLIIYFIFFNNKEVLESEDKKEDNTVVEEKKLTIMDINSTSRPVAVMINNYNEVQQFQSGLNDAYVVYEMIVEAGITRMMAIYKDSSVERIGSIRSSRHYFLDYALEHDAIYTHIGYSEIAKEDIYELNVANIDGDYYWREDIDLAYEHRAFTSMSNILKDASSLNYRLNTSTENMFNYSIDSVVYNDYELANDIYIKYSSAQINEYNYNSSTGMYEKTSNGEKRLDYITGEAVSAKNVITYQVNNYTIAGDTAGRQELETVGSGEGYLFTEGKVIKINWSKSSRTAQTKYTYLNGEEVVLNDGVTHIQIQPLNEEINFN